MNKQKLLKKILSGSKNIRFDEMVALAEAFGFKLSRVSDSHHIFIHSGMKEFVNLQNWADKRSLIKFDSSCVWSSGII